MLESQKDRPFSWILSKDVSYEYGAIDDSRGLSTQINLYPSEKIRWQLATKVDHLNLSMSRTGSKTSQRPMNILAGLAGAVMMGRCCHPENELIARKVPRHRLLSPGSNRLSTGMNSDEHAIYPLYGNEELKLLALASTTWIEKSSDLNYPMTIINRGACVNCLLEVYHRAECRYIIL